MRDTGPMPEDALPNPLPLAQSSCDAVIPIAVEQGEFVITSNPLEELRSLLGSCVAICLHDPVARVGGMTHTVFPEKTGMGAAIALNEFELLYNAMMKQGAQRQRLRASVVGGSQMIKSSRGIGSNLGQVTLEVLQQEDVTIDHVDLGGTEARRVRFAAVSGTLKVRKIAATVEAVAPVSAPKNDGLELF